MPHIPSHDNPFLNFFEEDPLGQRALFFGALPENLTFGQQRFGMNLFQPTFDRFLATLGRQVTGGEGPTATFADFLNREFSGNQFQNQFRRAPQFQTGVGSLSRPARFLFQR